MRLPVFPNISTKDGTSNKNARLTNVLKVSGPKEIAEIRPALVESAVSTGNGNGLVSFNDELISVYGATLGVSVVEGGSGGGSIPALATIQAGKYDFAQSTI